jgi:predicted glycoside hydrolase/deacetylase ChbG (UPF0249 family)
MIRALALILSSCVAAGALANSGPGQAAAPEVLLRLDDAGMNRSVNRAIEKVAATGMPLSVSVIFAAPQWQEAVAILKKYPRVAVGVHLALNAEWRDYRWGPVLGRSVPSLVDSAGWFHASRDAFLASRYDLGEVEREITAQVERALSSGLKITYVDAHMAMLEATPALREVLERVAKRHGLAVSRRFGESYFTLWNVPVESKQASLLAHLNRAKRDTVNLVVIHAAERTPEMEALFDLNAPAQNTMVAGVAAHRSAELAAILSPVVAALVQRGAIRLTTYEELARRTKR